MVGLLVLLLFGCTDAQFPPIHLGKGKKMTPEEFRQIPDDPMSDPADDIPPVPDYAKPRDSPASLGMKHKNLLPRDQYLEEEKMNIPKPRLPKKEEHMFINFQQIHDKLIEEQAQPEPITRKPYRQQGYTANVPPENDRRYKDKYAELESHSFGLNGDNIFLNASLLKYLKPIVWSTCEDFKRGGSRNFNPEDIINILWVPFYTWSDMMVVGAVVHKFTIPTQLQVYEYQKKYGPYLNRTIDWTQPKLFLEQDLGSSNAMLVAADRTALYYMIFDNEIPEFVQHHKITLPLITVRVKIDRDYLAMMYCEELFTLIMARDGHVPPTNKEKRETAKILGFRGKGRPVVRDEENEQIRRKAVEERVNYLKALKYLPTDPGAGYFDGLSRKETPMGRSYKIPK